MYVSMLKNNDHKSNEPDERDYVDRSISHSDQFFLSMDGYVDYLSTLILYRIDRLSIFHGTFVYNCKSECISISLTDRLKDI